MPFTLLSCHSLWSDPPFTRLLRRWKTNEVSKEPTEGVEKPSEVRGGTPVKRRRVTAGGWKEPTEPKERNHEISTGKILNHKLCLRLVRLVRYSRRSVLSSLGRYLSRSAPLWSLHPFIPPLVTPFVTLAHFTSPFGCRYDREALLTSLLPCGA